MNQTYLYLFAPLHTGGTTQEGNLVGIARESHTNLPYIPSSTIRGKLRASVKNQDTKFQLFGNELGDTNAQLEQGDVWIGDASILFLPVPSLSHGIVWVTSPLLLYRWARYQENSPQIPEPYSCSFVGGNQNISVYLKDAIFKYTNNQETTDLTVWQNWQEFIPQNAVTKPINKLLVLPDQHCATLIEMSLWRQVKIKLDEHKSVDGGFRYEDAIPPDTLMYYTNGLTSKANGNGQQSLQELNSLISNNNIIQFGGQESLGRGFCQQWN
ncbi:type III-B CRISPR module RAMP protein Cmr4 (plasmid) [Cyanobacterium sp. IPPAS B-1200]|uniref:type III-B CRISPR module RAMP protein Cmr4 n=1 Tax=Cyanobacterium sp. IPPAS B-1200 TaxID=1562720 RepID=UPI0008527C01|nr:type III-B CRISPR module RAMP protein Cmr4 [Cyanobacterium sp. IPPAS B-1200]OEJ80036.1 type III-B CRISPR module RAMP protein Cmr4 [Cyanobacterium sp. IPPAS B-1200]